MQTPTTSFSAPTGLNQSGNLSSAQSPGAAPGAQAQADRHSLSLKVMRLSKPTFFVGSPILCEPTDIPSNVILKKDSFSAEPFGLSDLLTLPHSFGFIYLGETFTSYISINNTSTNDVTNVAVKAELQTANARFQLLEIPTTQIMKLKPGENKDYIIQHQVIEEGIHILICSATYQKHDGEKKYFRKFFKFQVENPFDIKTNTHNQGNDIFLEVHVQNTSKVPLFVQSITFEPTEQFNVTDYNNNTSDGNLNSSKEIHDILFLKQSNIRQSLYKLEPKKPDDPSLKFVETIGRIEVVWRSALGETGKLRRDPISRKLPQRQEVELVLSNIPSSIILEKPFSVQCEITNRSGGLLIPKLSLQKNKMTGIMINGISGINLGPLQQNATKVVTLNLFPLKPGVQKITGLRIIELQTDKKYDFDNIIDVFVEEDPNNTAIL